MLTIIKSQMQSRLRPKYHPINDFPQWLVYDSTLHKSVFGPTTLKRCNDYILKGAKPWTKQCTKLICIQ